MRSVTFLLLVVYFSLVDTSQVFAVSATQLKQTPKIYKQQAAVIVLWCQTPTLEIRKFFNSDLECGRALVKPVIACWKQAQVETEIEGQFTVKLTRCVNQRVKREMSLER